MKTRTTKDEHTATLAWSYRCQHIILLLCISGETLMIVTFFLNLYEENPEESFWIQCIQYIFLLVYLNLAAIGFFLGFLAVFMEDSGDLKLGIRFLLIATAVYLFLSLLSIVPHDVCRRISCPGGRCSDHHWLHGGSWRHIYGHGVSPFQSEQNDSHEAAGTKEIQSYYTVSEISSASTNNSSLSNHSKKSQGFINKPLDTVEKPEFRKFSEDTKWLRYRKNETLGRVNGINNVALIENLNRTALDKHANDSRKRDVFYVILSILNIVVITGYFLLTIHILKKYKKYIDETTVEE